MKDVDVTGANGRSKKIVKVLHWSVVLPSHIEVRNASYVPIFRNRYCTPSQDPPEGLDIKMGINIRFTLVGPTYVYSNT